MNKVASILIVLTVIACSSPKIIEYRGPNEFEGKGGTVETIDGIDFWITGTPNCKFKVLGYTAYNPESYAVDVISRKVLISKVKEIGGDGVVIIDKESRASGVHYFGGMAHIDYSSNYWMAVVKYLK